MRLWKNNGITLLLLGVLFAAILAYVGPWPRHVTRSQKALPGALAGSAGNQVATTNVTPKTVDPGFAGVTTGTASGTVSRCSRDAFVAALAEKSRIELESVRQHSAQEGCDQALITGDENSKLMAIRNGKAYVAVTHNRNAGISIAADQVRRVAPFNLTGRGRTAGLWDSGGPRETHQELAGRASIIDGFYWYDHATHVAGTIAAAGIVPAAIGMSPEVRLDCYEWTSDLSEMASIAMGVSGESGKLQISNHSYGYACGWSSSIPPRWYGTWGNGESDGFGSYESDTADTDALCWIFPYYLPFLSAGNDRLDNAPSEGAVFEYYDSGWKQAYYSASIHPHSDNWDGGGYDTIGARANAKNVMTVGSVRDAVSGGVRSIANATMTSYSSWGPTDDGRIKPDLVANGDNLFSSSVLGDAAYITMSGSSMSVAAASGGAVLLTEYYGNLFTNGYMRASTLKGLLIHTADDLENPGPDYRTGWGLINIRAACDQVRRQRYFPEAGWIQDGTISNVVPSQTFAFAWTNTGPIKATICWSDPPGEAVMAVDNPALKLVNDLDIRVVDPLGMTNVPYVLDPTNPASVATTGDNFRDNVEQVYIASPGVSGVYTAVVSVHGVLTGDAQPYSLFLSGAAVAPLIVHSPLDNTNSATGPYVVEAKVMASDGISAGSPVVMWNTNGSTSVFFTNVMTRAGDDTFRAELPGQARGTVVSYFIRASGTNGLVSTHPSGAPAAMHEFEVVNSVKLLVIGNPEGLGDVAPAYGSTYFPSGVVVHASAPSLALETPGSRYRLAGWVGIGSAPSFGTSNSVDFRIDRFSALSWLWTKQSALVQTSSIAGVISTQSWWDASSYGQTDVAMSDILVGAGRTRYRFSGWTVNGIRMADARNVALNPVSGILMSTSKTAVAVYIRADLDADIDGLPDWWEMFYFGSLDRLPGGDDDGDGFSNIKETLDGTDPMDPGSTPAYPVINHVPMSNPAGRPAPWVATATITDNYQVVSATLHWKKGAEPHEFATNMLRSGVSDTYSGTIPAPGVNGDSFEYWISAADNAGYVASNEVTSFSVRYPELGLMPTSCPRVVLMPGASTNLTLLLTNSGMVSLDWRMTNVTAGIADDIESGTNQWVHGGVNDLWNITTRRAYTGSHSWYCGRTSDGQYMDGMNASLVSRPVRLGVGARLTFNHWPAMEYETWDFFWDGGIVELSNDGGVSYTQITPAGGYPYRITPNPASPFPSATPCFAGTGGWRPASFDLSTYAGQTVLIRFRFGSDSYTVDEGWYIDDVLIEPGSRDTSWMQASPDNGLIPPGMAMPLSIAFDSLGVLNGSDVAAFIDLISNDPVTPTNGVFVAMSVRSPPAITIDSAGQTSHDGSGRVSISNTIWDADGAILGVEMLYSTNSGATWSDPWISGAGAVSGTVSISNGISLSGIVTELDDQVITNRVAVGWNTFSNSLQRKLVTNMIVACKAWDGYFWSSGVTSQPFMVDNEAPGVPSGFHSDSHVAGSWSTNNIVSVSWANAAGDGDGIGVAGYGFVFTNPAISDAPVNVMTSGSAIAGMPLPDGADWWLCIRAVDLYGNAGATTGAGPYKVDTIPPSSASAIVRIDPSLFGQYVVGDTITNHWSGFADTGSGISGYYYSLTNGEFTTNGVRTIGTSGVSRCGSLNQTNTVYVWAVDNAGLAGSAASAGILVLQSGADWDHDRRSNGQEEISGSSADDSANVFRINRTDGGSVSGGIPFRFGWNSVAGRLYSVYSCGQVGADWEPDLLFTNVPGTGAMLFYTNTAPDDARLFKLEVRLSQ